MALDIYKKFLIYKEIFEGEKISLIAKKYNVSRDTVYKIKSEGFFTIKDEQKVVLDYIEKEPFGSIVEISKKLNLDEIFIYRTLKKFNVITFKQLDNIEVEIINFLLKQKNYRILNEFLYYNNVEFEPEIIDFSNLETEFTYLEYLKIYHKVSKRIDVLKELEKFLQELKFKGMIFTYLKALVSKIDILILKNDLKEVVDIIEKIDLDKLISISLKARFYNSYLNVLSRIEEFSKSILAMKKLEALYKKLPLYQKDNIRDFICASYYNWGNHKKAIKFSSDYSIVHAYVLYALGKYSDVINYKCNFNDPHTNYLLTSIKAFSYLFLNKPQIALETMISAYNIEDIVFEDYLERYYTFVITYHKYFGNEIYLKYFQEYKERLSEKVDRHFYAIVSGNSSILKDTPKDKLIKYYLEGKLSNALYLAKKYGMKTILNFLLLFHPKSYDRLKKYKEFSDFINFAIKPKIKLYLLRKRPFFVYKNKKFYLKDRGISVEIIKLLLNSRIAIWHFTKEEIKYMKYKMKLPIEQVGNEIILNADIYLDFKEAELSYKSKDMRRFKMLFKSLPWGLDYHSNEFINSIIRLSKNLKK